MVIHFEKLSQALDAFNANRIETEQVAYWEIVQDIEDPMDENEILKLCVELYSEAF